MERGKEGKNLSALSKTTVRSKGDFEQVWFEVDHKNLL